MKNFKFSSLSRVPVAALLALLAACGGGGGDAAPPPASTTPVLRSIAVAVPNATIPIGTSQTLTATGTYSDGSTKPLTAATGIKWDAKSGTASVLQVFTTGIVTGKAVGTETVNASQDGVTGSVGITVTSPWNMVAAGNVHTIARKADGNLYSWGVNLNGQLGDGSTDSRTAPVTVSATSPVTAGVWKQIVAGENFAVGIRAASATATSGTLWAWGYSQNGRLGLGASVSTDKSVPTQIGSATDWTFIAAGRGHALAINSKGALYAWGRNFNGQLGDATTADSPIPKLVGGTPATGTTAATWVTVAAGDTHTLGIQKDGSLWAWGGGGAGQVGNASTTEKISTPVKIGTSTWSSVAAGGSHSVAIRADGTLWAWGLNTFGQLGNNGTAQLQVPAQIGTADNWAVIAGGALHTMGVRSDGTLWGWGANEDGQLGDGGVSSPQPVQIGVKTNWRTVSLGAFHSFGLQSDNTLWGWGRNAEGQLGNGTKVQSSIPVNVPN